MLGEVVRLEISIAHTGDLEPLLQLYTRLHDNPFPKINEDILRLWSEIVADKNHWVIVGKEGSKLVSSCVIVVIPNLTHGQSPYALIENVITDEGWRNKGYATQILDYAREIAKEKRCYKMMLMTGSKKESTINFYKRAGYHSEDKTAFIQWL